MIPPILQQLGRNQTGPIKQMMDMVKMSRNPQAMIQQMMNQNPQMRQAMEIINKYGGDAKQAFLATAQEKGVDPEEILGMLK